MRVSVESWSKTLIELSNGTLFLSSFSTELKISVLNLVFKKDGPLKTKTNWLVSVLPVVSNFFAILHKQMSLSVKNFLCRFPCGYNKNIHHTASAVITIRKLKNCRR